MSEDDRPLSTLFALLLCGSQCSPPTTGRGWTDSTCALTQPAFTKFTTKNSFSEKWRFLLIRTITQTQCYSSLSIFSYLSWFSFKIELVFWFLSNDFWGSFLHLFTYAVMLAEVSRKFYTNTNSIHIVQEAINLFLHKEGGVLSLKNLPPSPRNSAFRYFFRAHRLTIRRRGNKAQPTYTQTTLIYHSQNVNVGSILFLCISLAHILRVFLHWKKLKDMHHLNILRALIQ